MTTKTLSSNLYDIYKKYSYEKVYFQFMLGKQYLTYFDSSLEKDKFEKTLDLFIKQNKWVEVDNISYYLYYHKNNSIKILPNNYKTNHKTKLYYSNLITNTSDPIIKKNHIIDKYVNETPIIADHIKTLVSMDIPVTTKYLEKDENISKRSLLELENDKLFTNYFIPSIDKKPHYRFVNKVFFKFTDCLTLHFDEIKSFIFNKLSSTFYKIYLKVEINNDIDNTIDTTINTKINLPSYKLLSEKLNDIISIYNNIEISDEVKEFYISDENVFNIFPKTVINYSFPYQKPIENNNNYEQKI
jgi:hypothetical protein